jgi:hypothetical protein
MTQRRKRIRRWYTMVGVLGVLTVIATCGVFSFYLVRDELAGRHAQATAGQDEEIVFQDISSREADPVPLTVDEVFPTDEIIINPAEPGYEILATQESDDCGVAAADELAELLEKLGCSQVVRATLRSPTDGYLITGGILNLATEADAERAYQDIKPLVEEGTGRFLGLLAGEGTEAIVLSETVLFWDYRGHYLMYAVVARADGGTFSATDNRYADLVSWDIIEVHLRGGVLEARVTQSTGSPTPTPTDRPEDTESD